MLVIVSDLHFTDGTTGMRVPADAFKIFAERLEDMAFNASNPDGENYDPLKTFDLILLGDIFDMVRSVKWTEQEKGQPGYARPWSDPQSPAFLAKIDEITQAILAKNAEAFAIIKGIADGTQITLPPPTKAGNVDQRYVQNRHSVKRLPVKVNIYYVLGNHDWYFHLQGSAMQAIRQKIAAALGLANPAAFFPHDPEESPEVKQALLEHSIWARHGDLYDGWNYPDGDIGRDQATLSDAMCVELFNRIPVRIQQALSGKLPAEFFSDLNEMGSVRPSWMTPAWVALLLERHNVSKENRKVIDEIWHELVRQFLELDYLKQMDTPSPFDDADKVQILLGLLKNVSIEKLDGLGSFIDKMKDVVGMFMGGALNYERKAMQEALYKSKDVRFIVYGHTHGYKVFPLRTVQKDNKPFDQLYLNSGTWHPLHDLGHDQSQGRGFIFHKTMTYLSFYKDAERKGRLYETWSGTLDM